MSLYYDFDPIARKHRRILKLEVIELRDLPGDTLWSLSLAPVQALIDFAAVVVDEMLPSSGAAETYSTRPDSFSHECSGPMPG